MTLTIYTLHGVDPAKLAAVKAEMTELGAPTIRVVDCGDYYQALEGTHRLHAAHDLGLTPELVVLAQDDLVAADGFDLQGLQVSESYTAGELAGEVYSPASRALTFAGNV